MDLEIILEEAREIVYGPSSEYVDEDYEKAYAFHNELFDWEISSDSYSDTYS